MKRIIAMLCAVMLVLALCSCSGGGTTQTKPLNEVFADIKSSVDLGEVLEYTDVAMLDRYYGISADEVEEFAGCVNSSGTDQTEIVLIKAVNIAAAEKVEEVLNNKYNSKLNENRNYNPEQAAMIEKCKVERNGQHVAMIISADAEAITKIYESGIIPQ